MRSIAGRKYTPVLEGLNALVEERGRVVEGLPLVAGQRSVMTFGISTEDGKRIVYRLGRSLVSEHDDHCCQSMTKREIKRIHVDGSQRRPAT